MSIVQRVIQSLNDHGRGPMAALGGVSATALASLTLFMAILVWLGYWLSVEVLYRPIPGGAATHPLTALMMTLSSSCIVINTCASSRLTHRGLCIVSLLLALLISVDWLAGTSWRLQLSPFSSFVAHEKTMGLDNDVGINTSLTFLLLAVAQMLSCRGAILLSQLVALCAVFLPSVSLVGYLYRFDDFHGQMSLYTTLTGLFLSWAALLQNAQRGGVRVVLSGSTSGGVIRIQWLVSLLMPVVLGYFLVQYSDEGVPEVFALFVVSVIWVNCVNIFLSGMYHDRVERRYQHSEEQLTLAASRDALTGLCNRGRFMEILLAEMRRSQRTGKPPWLLMIDADHFKRVNDTEGHLVGDRVLVKLAEVLNGHTRKVDTVARIGGEEFCVLLVDTTQRGAAGVAENLRRAVETMQVEGWTDLHGPITVSIGIAGMHGREDSESFLKRADEALYQAKSLGRNQVCLGKNKQVPVCH